jgi:hypothetical protein
MPLRPALIAVIVGSAVTFAACGGQEPPPAAPAPLPAPAAPKIEEAPPAKTPASLKTAAEHHREFMAGCAKKAINSPDYCECAWTEFRKAFTDEEMSAGDMPPAKLEKVKGQVMGACASKIPEENVRADFGKACIGAKPELKAYCDCTWTEFRKRFSTAELNDEATVSSDRFLAARPPVVKACGAKMPESVSKEAFMKGCMKDPSVDKFCGCAWKELRKQASPAEIESGTFEQKTLFAQVDKTCGKLRPPKP